MTMATDRLQQPPGVLIFRNNLFRWSETFITTQAEALKAYRPVYAGRFRFGDGPRGSVVHTLAGLPGQGPLLPALWHLLSRDPRGLARRLHDCNPRLIHAHFGIDGVYALPLAQRLGIPLVTSFHGFDATLSTTALLSSPAWALYPIFRARLARSGNLFLCASNFLRERVLAMGFPAERTRVHYVGIDSQTIMPREDAEERPVVLHVARLTEVKGTEYLIRAMARLRGPAAAYSLVIVGDGPLRPALVGLSRALGIADRVRFLGTLPHAEVMAWTRKAAVLVLPSIPTRTGRTEGLGMVLLEAAATGVPLIGSRSGGIPEVVLNGDTGWLVADRDDEDLARRLHELLAEAPMRRRMGRAARRHIEQNFDLGRQTERLEQHYRDAIEQFAGAQGSSA
jgi:glycosyltransferase involved in cell wall biosynthesis